MAGMERKLGWLALNGGPNASAAPGATLASCPARAFRARAVVFPLIARFYPPRLRKDALGDIALRDRGDGVPIVPDRRSVVRGPRSLLLTAHVPLAIVRDGFGGIRHRSQGTRERALGRGPP